MSRFSLGVAILSTVVEWYDFTLYLYFATTLGRVFFGGGSAGLSAALAGFAIAYLLRPLGAIVFGHIGDHHGRRASMLASVALMTFAMLATALLPTQAMIGTAAGLLLLGLRCVMSFSVGGEYAVVVAYLLEGAPSGRRGLVASLASAASEIGALLAVGVAYLTVTFTGNGLDNWGWRIPFFFGAGLAASVWIARAGMEESPDFLRQRDSGTLPANPLGHVLRHNKRGIARSFAISALGSITFYVGITYIPAFLVSTATLSESAALNLSTLATLAVIAVTPLAGIASDRFGRKPVLLVLALCQRGAADHPVSGDGGCRADGYPGRRGGAGVRRGRRQRGRRGGDCRTVFGRGPGQWSGIGRDVGDRDLRRPHTMAGALADTVQRMAIGAGHHDRGGGLGGAAGVLDCAGNAALATSTPCRGASPTAACPVPAGSPATRRGLHGLRRARS